MDPNANLREQEEILNTPAKDRDRARLKELREALWGWLDGHGFEPTWHKWPKAARYFRSYGGSNATELLT